MPDYEKLYYFLFNAISDALHAGHPDAVRDILIAAQQEAEERYLQSP